MSSWKDKNAPWNVDDKKSGWESYKDFEGEMRATKISKSYNEGHVISYSDDPSFLLDHNGVPISPGHNPCGYWWGGMCDGDGDGDDSWGGEEFEEEEFEPDGLIVICDRVNNTTGKYWPRSGKIEGDRILTSWSGSWDNLTFELYQIDSNGHISLLDVSTPIVSYDEGISEEFEFASVWGYYSMLRQNDSLFVIGAVGNNFIHNPFYAILTISVNNNIIDTSYLDNWSDVDGSGEYIKNEKIVLKSDGYVALLYGDAWLERFPIIKSFKFDNNGIIDHTVYDTENMSTYDATYTYNVRAINILNIRHNSYGLAIFYYSYGYPTVSPDRLHVRIVNMIGGSMNTTNSKDFPLFCPWSRMFQAVETFDDIYAIAAVDSGSDDLYISTLPILGGAIGNVSDSETKIITDFNIFSAGHNSENSLTLLYLENGYFLIFYNNSSDYCTVALCRTDRSGHLDDIIYTLVIGIIANRYIEYGSDAKYLGNGFVTFCYNNELVTLKVS